MCQHYERNPLTPLEREGICISCVMLQECVRHGAPEEDTIYASHEPKPHV